ncbi:MAG: nicotinate-nicotinamide nucleotide adenylyltransferase, partial [Acidimicrobiales bacterium]
VSPAEDRLAMVSAAIDGVERAEVSRIELDRGGQSYSVDTAEALLAAATAADTGPPELVLIVGADVVSTLDSWHRAADLSRLVTVAVVARPGAEALGARPGWHLVVVGGTSVDVSSSQVRDLVAAGRSIDGLVPLEVERCIRSRGMYAVSR